MKKMILICALVSGVYQLKAQQLFPIKQADTISIKIPGNYKPNNNRQLIQPLQNLNQISNNSNILKTTSDILVDHIPVIKLEGDSKMPVIALGGYSKMTVVALGDYSNGRVKPMSLFSPTNFGDYLKVQPNIDLQLLHRQKIATEF